MYVLFQLLWKFTEHAAGNFDENFSLKIYDSLTRKKYSWIPDYSSFTYYGTGSEYQTGLEESIVFLGFSFCKVEAFPEEKWDLIWALMWISLSFETLWWIFMQREWLSPRITQPCADACNVVYSTYCVPVPLITSCCYSKYFIDHHEVI